jgi:hypothetical protein
MTTEIVCQLHNLYCLAAHHLGKNYNQSRTIPLLDFLRNRPEQKSSTLSVVLVQYRNLWFG